VTVCADLDFLVKWEYRQTVKPIDGIFYNKAPANKGLSPSMDA
jgi:hypothetical protein